MSKTVLAMFVPGRPRPQGSKRIARGRLIESSRGLRRWREAVAMAALAARQEVHEQWPIADAVKVGMVFYVRHPAAKPDIDKLARAVLDALVQAGIIADDAIVVHLEAWKWAAGEGEGEREGVAVRVMR